MNPIIESIRTLFRETIHGRAPGADGTWFVQSGEALVESLLSLSATQASVRIGGAASIAAHTLHLTYYVRHANEHMAGLSPSADWDGSWAVHEVSDSEWREALDQLRSEAGRFDAFLEKRSSLPEDSDDLTYWMAVLAHTAYHLGAIRQAILALKR